MFIYVLNNLLRLFFIHHQCVGATAGRSEKRKDKNEKCRCRQAFSISHCSLLFVI